MWVTDTQSAETSSTPLPSTLTSQATLPSKQRPLHYPDLLEKEVVRLQHLWQSFSPHVTLFLPLNSAPSSVRMGKAGSDFKELTDAGGEEGAKSLLEGHKSCGMKQHHRSALSWLSPTSTNAEQPQ